VICLRIQGISVNWQPDRRLRRDTLKEIGRQIKIEKYSSVSSIIKRVKRQMDEDAGFRKRIDELSSKLTKGQRQI
jgi:hypothetical protein